MFSMPNQPTSSTKLIYFAITLNNWYTAVSSPRRRSAVRIKEEDYLQSFLLHFIGSSSVGMGPPICAAALYCWRRMKEADRWCSSVIHTLTSLTQVSTSTTWIPLSMVGDIFDSQLRCIAFFSTLSSATSTIQKAIAYVVCILWVRELWWC